MSTLQRARSLPVGCPWSSIVSQYLASQVLWPKTVIIGFKDTVRPPLAAACHIKACCLFVGPHRFHSAKCEKEGAGIVDGQIKQIDRPALLDQNFEMANDIFRRDREGLF